MDIPKPRIPWRLNFRLDDITVPDLPRLDTQRQTSTGTISSVSGVIRAAAIAYYAMTLTETDRPTMTAPAGNGKYFVSPEQVPGVLQPLIILETMDNPARYTSVDR